MMETSFSSRGRGSRAQGGGRGHSKNKTWIAGQDNVASGSASDSERWERGAHRRARGRGRGVGHFASHLQVPFAHQEDGASGTDEGHSVDGDGVTDGEEQDLEVEMEAPDPETPQERERFWQELVKAREVERKTAIAEGKMDDPTVSKRLDEAITMVGTCMCMCPRFERYRRERENNLDKWEVIPGTKRVDHKRAVKIYERAAGDKTLPSDLRPPPVLKKTLDYLFHNLLVKEGFTQTYDFIRDRSRAVRSDFTMQHEQGALAIECHDRCARFHILALHLERNNQRFSVALEEQQLMNTLQSLKEFYEDQRGKYQAPTELEMRVYHRLIHIRDQKERREDIPDEITSHPVFQYTTQFRHHVQMKSAPITKTSRLVVDLEGMQIFAQLAAVLREQGNVVMIYLVACILERLFGKDTIDDIEAIRGDLTIPDIIDGISRHPRTVIAPAQVEISTMAHQPLLAASTNGAPPVTFGSASAVSPFGTPTFGTGGSPASTSTSSQPVKSAFASLTSTPNVFGNSSAFSGSTPSAFQATSAFGGSKPSTFGTSSPFGGSTSQSIFGSANEDPKPVFGTPSQPPAPAPAPTPASSGQFPTSQSVPSLFGGSSSGTVASTAFPSSQSVTFPSGKPFSVPNGSFPNPISTPQPPPLNPFAPSFTPTPPKPSTPSASPFQTPPPSYTLNAPRFPTNATLSTPQTSAASSPDHVRNIVSQAPTLSPFAARQEEAPAAKTPGGELQALPQIVERQQTLWDIPGSVQPHTPPKEPPTLTIPTYTAPAMSPLPATPTGPPPPPKPQPMSLPPTPTARWFDPSSQNGSLSSSVSRKSSLLGFPLQMPASVSASSSLEMLSPLHLHTPSGSKSFPVLNGSPSPQLRASPPPAAPMFSPAAVSSQPAVKVNMHSSSKGKGKGKETAVDLEKRLSDYLKTSPLVRRLFKLWAKKITDRAVYLEACRRSDEYQAKVQRERLSSSFSTGSIQSKSAAEQNKRRRVSAMEPPRARKTRRRLAAPTLQPLNDDDLVQRLKENHEEHKRRWAQGSFLRSVRSRLKTATLGGQPSPEWRIWLSLNPESDGTAIWIEHKWDVPASGNWESETVFSIPALPSLQTSLSRGSPGLIVFERTPLEDLPDEIERKYRILDDCSRLRDVVEGLPQQEDLRFAPSLLVIQWTNEANTPTKNEDFTDMVKKHVTDGVFKAVATFAISSKATDLDGKFVEVLKTIPLDVQDRLSVTVTWRELSNRFAAPLKTIMSDWLESCWDGDTLDWFRFGHVSQAVKDLQTLLARGILNLVGRPSDVVVPTTVDLETFFHLGKGYVIDAFLDAHTNLPLSIAGQLLGAQPSTRFVLPRAQFEAATTQFESALQTQNDGLREVLMAPSADNAKPSPKRRSVDDDPTDSLPASQSRKRMRSSSFSSVDGDPTHVTNGVSSSPPPSTTTSTTGATDGTERPYVTVAMLRSLTRDVLKSYGKNQK